jgi:hypothetical protein
MKLTCDLCGGALQMNAGAQDASCKNCGMCYPLEMLRERLKAGNAPLQNTIKDPHTPIFSDTPARQIIDTPIVQQTSAPQPKPAAEQFIMPVESLFAACLTGTVQQGTIGIGERVYINGDYSTPYRLRRFGDDAATTHASAGEYARLYLVPNRKDAMKQARTITGDPTPTENAYRFSGSVESYFADLLQKHFREYTLQQQVQWPGLKVPVSFMLMDGNRPVAAIFVFDSHDSRSRYQAQKAAKLFADAGIGCTHFFREYRNDAAYVTDRIRAAIG